MTLPVPHSLCVTGNYITHSAYNKNREGYRCSRTFKALIKNRTDTHIQLILHDSVIFFYELREQLKISNEIKVITPKHVF